MIEYTEGPWQVGKLPPNGDKYIVAEDGEYIAAIAEFDDEGDFSHYLCHDEEKARANAQVIAAAPELLGACKYALGLLSKVDIEIETTKIHKAINKAEGDNDD